MAKRKKRSKVQKRKLRRNSAKRSKARRVSRVAPKRTVAKAKPKRTAKKAVRRMKQPVAAVVETVEVIEKPIAITEMVEAEGREVSPGPDEPAELN